MCAGEQLASGRSSSRTQSLWSGATKPRPGWADELEAASRMDWASCCFTAFNRRRSVPGRRDLLQLSSVYPTEPVPTDPGEVPPKLLTWLYANSTRGAITQRLRYDYTVAMLSIPVISTTLIQLQG